MRHVRVIIGNLEFKNRLGGTCVRINAKTGTGRWNRLWLRLFSRQLPRINKAADTADVEATGRALTVPSDVRASAHKDGLAILRLSTGQMFLCNETGARIWQGVIAGLSADAITEQISQEFGVGTPLVRRHTFSFLFELERRGLLVPRAEC
jgi:hypothetical protein